MRQIFASPSTPDRPIAPYQAVGSHPDRPSPDLRSAPVISYMPELYLFRLPSCNQLAKYLYYFVRRCTGYGTNISTGNMKLQHISQAGYDRIEGVRRIIVHDCPHQFALLDLGEPLGHYGISWRSSPIIQPVIMPSKDELTLWLEVDPILLG
ncbi:MAG: hypothetical protein GDA56_06205 [Hormoscilla sp. GM7CHS1pb]|nr:hypothetical protein [Hormoscilla sp. GM7CHS1pb]